MKYLIVDDDPTLRELMKEEICLDSDTVFECTDGEDAVVAYSEHLPDLVLMDVRMKSINGIAATKLIREQYRTARIIIITNYDTPSIRDAALKAGAVAFFSKENLFKVKEYVATIGKSIE